MVDLIVQAMDVIALVAGIIASFYLFKNYNDVQGEGALKKGIGWLAAGTFFIFLRKVSDVLGEYIFIQYNYTFNLTEDLFFALGMIFIVIGSNTIYKFFRSIKFK